MKKKARKIVIMIIVLVLIIYMAMFLDTNGLMRQVRDAFLWKPDILETENRPINAYNYSRYASSETLGEIQLTLVRLFVFHNFQDGYIWAYYSYEAYNQDGSLLTGSHSIPTKWKIHKENGKWEIVEIFEAL